MEKGIKDKIKNAIQATRLRRQTQRCRSIELKLDKSKMSKSTYKALKFLFVQCKWLYNYLLSLDKEEFKKFDTKTRVIYSIDKDGNKVERTLTLPATIIQTVYSTLKQNLKSLYSSKKKGRKIGKLKFKSEYNAIEFKQYNVTHYIKGKKVKIAGFKLLKAFGTEQISPSWELADAKLILKPSGIYLKQTCYENLTLKDTTKHSQVCKEVGLDYGIKTNITTSENEQFNVMIEESERLKGLQRKKARQTKGSNSYNKTRLKIQREYEKLTNLKNDAANKLVHYLCSNYSTVYMQDEMIGNWHKGLFGKQIQHSILGRLKSKLTEQNNVRVIDKSYPTTKLCYHCGTLHKDISLDDRTFICPSCGFTEERDLKAAKTVLFIGQCKNSYAVTGHNSTTVERMSDFLASYETKKQSAKACRPKTA